LGRPSPDPGTKSRRYGREPFGLPSVLPFLRSAAPAASGGSRDVESGTDRDMVGAGQRGRFGAAMGGRDTGQA